jgi:hypothetical protein
VNNTASSSLKLIAWNGVQLKVPSHWEAIVSGPGHLIFEDDFNPVFHIRWSRLGDMPPHKWQQQSDLWWQQLGVNSKPASLPVELNPLADTFTHLRYYKGKEPLANGGICYCDSCHTLILFQQLHQKNLQRQETAKALNSLSCHDCSESLWQIQDISLRLPEDHFLKDYSFKAGLTRISFTAGSSNLQFCRLSQAKSRLAAQPLPQILQTLSGVKDLDLSTDSKDTVCSGQRTPSVMRQILYRMRKEKPFIQAKIWKPPEHDRLLAYIASSQHPLAPTELSSYYETFKIVE